MACYLFFLPRGNPPLPQQLWPFLEGHLLTPCFSPAPFLTVANSHSRKLEDGLQHPVCYLPKEMVLHSLVWVVQISSTEASYLLNLRTVFVSGVSCLNQLCTSVACLCFWNLWHGEQRRVIVFQGIPWFLSPVYLNILAGRIYYWMVDNVVGRRRIFFCFFVLFFCKKVAVRI